MFLTHDLSTNKSKEYNTVSFQKLAMKTTLYTLRCPEVLHWFEWGQEDLEKLMCNQTLMSFHSATETSPHLVPSSKHTPNITQFSHIHKKSPPKSADFSVTRSSPTEVSFDRLQVSKVCKNTSSISCLEVFWLAFGMWNDFSYNLVWAVVCKAQVAEVAQQRAVSILIRQVLFTSCLLMDLEV